MKGFKGTPGPWFCEPSLINEISITGDGIDIGTVIAHPHNYLLTELEWANAKAISALPDCMAALKQLIHLHCCEQEGLSSGQPTHEQWLKAYDDGVAALEKADIDLSEF